MHPQDLCLCDRFDCLTSVMLLVQAYLVSVQEEWQRNIVPSPTLAYDPQA